MYIRLHRHPNALLLVDFQEKESNQCEVEYKVWNDTHLNVRQA